MRAYSLSHLGDPELLRGLLSLVAQDRATTATLLAHIGEFDARRLYLPCGVSVDVRLLRPRTSTV